MHLYFSGIGGSGLSPLAHLALDLGWHVSGSDKQENENTLSLQQRGATIYYDQSGDELRSLHEQNPIFWFVYTSSLPQNHPELRLATDLEIKSSKRSKLINFILDKQNLKLLAVAGTHGKTTTTSMLIWLFNQLQIPTSYIVGSTLTFGPSGFYHPDSKYLILECDEFDRNFLDFKPFISIFTTIDYDHPDTYPTKAEYYQAFQDFAAQSSQIVGFGEDFQKAGISPWGMNQAHTMMHILKRELGSKTINYDMFTLLGLHNRQNAALARKLFLELPESQEYHLELINQTLSTYPGSKRRMEMLSHNLFSDYAHHPDEIKATLQLASELNKKVVVVYQPHQNIRQHQVYPDYVTCFAKAEKVYWLPTFLTRENPDLEILTPEFLSSKVMHAKIVVSNLNQALFDSIQQEIANDHIVILMGAGSIDPWIHEQLSKGHEEI